MQIIPKKILPVETQWQKELANSFTDLPSLLSFLEIDDSKMSSFETSLHSKARKLFAMRVPKPFAELMQKGNVDDPLLQQVIPQHAEFNDVDGFVSDPLQEHSSKQSGVIHKYRSRLLLIVRTGCAVNCRYCFRREFPYQENHINREQYQKVLNYIAKDHQLNEVIFSGGDPLMANDQQLRWLISELEKIAHIKRLRIHTRLPIVIPQRVTPELLQTLKQTRLQTVMVFHINHPNEISADLMAKTQALKQAGVTLLNQAVLLRHINDNTQCLSALSEKLFDAGVLPYYLHLLDPINGAAHFDVSKDQAITIMRGLLASLPGFLVPKLVREVAGQQSKTPIDLELE